MKDWYWFAIWIGGWLLIAFVNGYADGDKKMGEADAGMVGAFWPVFLIIGILASPIWVPMLFADFGRYLRQHEERKELVKRTLDGLKKGE